MQLDISPVIFSQMFVSFRVNQLYYSYPDVHLSYLLISVQTNLPNMTSLDH